MSHTRPPKAPNLIYAGMDYGIQNEEQFRNQLRLYFNELDNFSKNLLIGSGGTVIDFPHIGAYYDADQFATADDTATKVLWNNAINASGFTLNVDSTATVSYDGIYKIEYRLQGVNTDNVAIDVVVWLQVNGSDVADSATKFTIPARKSSGVYTFNVLSSFVNWESTAGDTFALYWATEQAYESGVQDGIFLQSLAAQTSPYAHPEVPSAYGVIQYIGHD